MCEMTDKEQAEAVVEGLARTDEQIFIEAAVENLAAAIAKIDAQYFAQLEAE